MAGLDLSWHPWARHKDSSPCDQGICPRHWNTLEEGKRPWGGSEWTRLLWRWTSLLFCRWYFRNASLFNSVCDLSPQQIVTSSRSTDKFRGRIQADGSRVRSYKRKGIWEVLFPGRDCGVSFKTNRGMVRLKKIKCEETGNVRKEKRKESEMIWYWWKSPIPAPRELLTQF